MVAQMLPIHAETLSTERFWGKGSYCFQGCTYPTAHQAPMDSAKPRVTETDMAKLNRSETKPNQSNMNVRKGFVRVRGRGPTRVGNQNS